MQEKLTRSALSIIEHTPREDLLRKRVFLCFSSSVPKEYGAESTHKTKRATTFHSEEYSLPSEKGAKRCHGNKRRIASDECK